MLELISRHPKITQAAIATAMGWKLYSGEPNKMKASRALRELGEAKLIKTTRDGTQITEAGKKALKAETLEEEDAFA